MCPGIPNCKKTGLSTARENDLDECLLHRGRAAVVHGVFRKK
jgi:hypothetical protein